MRIRWTRLAGLAIGLMAWSAAAVAAHDTLGRVHFPASCAASEEAFDRARAMLHSSPGALYVPAERPLC